MSEALKRREINNETSKRLKVLEALLDEWPDHADELLVLSFILRSHASGRREKISLNLPLTLWAMH